jgi:hypothetical protein
MYSWWSSGPIVVHPVKYLGEMKSEQHTRLSVLFLCTILDLVLFIAGMVAKWKSNIFFNKAVFLFWAVSGAWSFKVFKNYSTTHEICFWRNLIEILKNAESYAKFKCIDKVAKSHLKTGCLQKVIENEFFPLLLLFASVLIVQEKTHKVHLSRGLFLTCTQQTCNFFVYDEEHMTIR